MPCCGSTDPGTLATASRNSRISAVRMDVSCRQAQRSQPARPSRTGPELRPPGALPDPGPAPRPGPGPGPLAAAAAAARRALPGQAGRAVWCRTAPAVRSSSYRLGRGRHEDSAVIRVIRVFSPLKDTPPTIRAAIRPCRSITSVVGVPSGRNRAPELQRDLIPGIVQARVADPEVAHEGQGTGRIIPDVDSDEPYARWAEPGRERGERGRFLPARRAPGTPEVQHDHRSPVAGQRQVLAGQRGAVDVRRGLP